MLDPAIFGLLLAQQVPPAASAVPSAPGTMGSLGAMVELLKTGGPYTVTAVLLWVVWKLYQDNQKLHRDREEIVLKLTEAQIKAAERVGGERQAEVREIISAVRTLSDFAQNARAAKPR